MIKRVFKNRKHYLRNILFEYFNVIILTIIPFIIAPQIIIKIGQSGYGLWILINTITSYFSLTSFGISNNILKEVPKFKHEKEELGILVSTSLGISIIIISIFSIIFIWIFIYFDKFNNSVTELKINYKLILLTSYLGVIINIFIQFYSNLLFAFNRLHIANIIKIIFNLANFTITCLLLLIVNDHVLEKISILNTLTSILILFLLSYLFNKYEKISIKIYDFNFKSLKKILKDSASFFVIGVSVYLVYYTDTIIIGKYLTLKDVTIYSLIFRIINLSNSFIFKISDVEIPNIGLAYNRSSIKIYVKKYIELTYWTIIASVIFYLLQYFFTQRFLEFWISKDLIINQNVFIIMLIFGFITTLTHINSTFIVSIGMQKHLAIISVFEGVSNLFFSILLCKNFGLVGVPLSSLIVHFFTSFIFSYFQIYKSIKFYNKYAHVNNNKALY